MSDIYSEESINTLLQWAQSAQAPNEPFQLSDWEYVEDPKKFLDTALVDVKLNYEAELYKAKPAIHRLNRLKEYLDNN